MLVSAEVRVRRARRAGFGVSAWVMSGGGRVRVPVLSDGTDHYAPIQPRLGVDLTLEGFLTLLSDPRMADRLRQPRIGVLPGLEPLRSLRARSVQDDGVLAALAHAQAVADGWLIVGDIVHQRVLAPSRTVRFRRDDHVGCYHETPLADPEPPDRTVYLRLAPGESAAPYAAALEAVGRSRATGKPHGIEPGDVPVAFGGAELVEDMKRCLPLTVSGSSVPRHEPREIRGVAGLGRRLRERDGTPLDVAAGLLDTLSGLRQSRLTLGASALFRERLARTA